MVYTAVKVDKNGAQWVRNTAGFQHSDQHGFGLMDAYRMARAAGVRKWTIVVNSMRLYECFASHLHTHTLTHTLTLTLTHSHTLTLTHLHTHTPGVALASSCSKSVIPSVQINASLRDSPTDSNRQAH